MSRVSRNGPCPCGSGRKYKGCCGAFHDGKPAPTPETLMRSRYSAYAAGEVSYLLATTAPESPHARADRSVWAEEVRRWCQAVEFRQLQVFSASEEGNSGEVRFFATLFHGAEEVSFGEISSFVRREGRWYYVAGEPFTPS